MSLNAIMLAHPSVQDLVYKAELVSHDASPLAITGYRLQVTLLARFGRMDSRHDGIRSAPSCTMSKYIERISRNRTRQGYSPEGFFLECFKAQKFVGIEPTQL